MILAPIPLSLAIALDSPIRRGLEAPAGAHLHITSGVYAVEKDAAAVRRFVRQNMLLGTMALEHAASVLAYDSVVRALRVAKAAAQIGGQIDVVRVIDGCETPLKSMFDRHANGNLRASLFEIHTLWAAGVRITDMIDNAPDDVMIIAYERVEALRNNPQTKGD